MKKAILKMLACGLLKCCAYAVMVLFFSVCELAKLGGKRSRRRGGVMCGSGSYFFSKK